MSPIDGSTALVKLRYTVGAPECASGGDGPSECAQNISNISLSNTVFRYHYLRVMLHILGVNCLTLQGTSMVPNCAALPTHVDVARRKKIP